jgi:hypothetical protein
MAPRTQFLGVDSLKRTTSTRDGRAASPCDATPSRNPRASDGEWPAQSARLRHTGWARYLRAVDNGRHPSRPSFVPRSGRSTSRRLGSYPHTLVLEGEHSIALPQWCHLGT